MPSPLRIAHRGMPRLAIENTLASFSMALAAGADGIELDVHATKDGVIVVHHDPALLAGHVLAESTYAELVRAMPELPTLQSVCELIVGRAELFVEIKGDGIEQEVDEVLTHYAGAFAIHSFDHALIERLAGARSKRRLGVLVEDTATDVVALLRRTGARDLWPHHPLVSAQLVSAVHDAGGRVIPWTVNAAQDIERVRALGVDGICTDDVRAIIPIEATAPL